MSINANLKKKKAEMKARKDYFKRYPEMNTEWNNKIYARAFKTGWNAARKAEKGGG